VRQREPAHRADAECDERSVEPELQAEAPAARRDQQADRGDRGAGKEGELQEAGESLRHRVVESPQHRDDERRDELECQCAGKPAPGDTAHRLQFCERGRARRDGDGGERCGHSRDEHHPLFEVRAAETRDHREDAETDAGQHEPRHPVVQPGGQRVAQAASGRLFAVQLHRAVLHFFGFPGRLRGKHEKSARS
jgi:hypothetical protein